MLDRNVEKILNMILLSPSFKNYQASDRPDLKKNATVTRIGRSGKYGIVEK